ncbi:MAG: DNA primase [bacterium]
MIPNSTIDEIRNKSDILQIIGEYVPLKKRGKNYIGLCPFHSEKTPSFTVSPEKQIFHCFGCNEGGNIFAFLMKIENIGFSESVALLGERQGIAVKKTITSPALQSEKDKHFGIMDLAQKFYRDALEGSEGDVAREYLNKRGINEASAKAFGLGYSPNKWDSLLNFLFKRGVSQKDMEKLGLIIERTDKSGFYDRFRGRLMFPIYDLREHVIGFGGRIIPAGTPASEEAKYINSPDSPIYNKGYSVYGINVTKDEIKRTRTVVLVEGNVDLITCWQYGIKNVICPLGTALTPNQAKIIRRFADNVILAFDRDSAGNTATARSVEILKDEGLSVKVSAYEGGKDPDGALKAKGAESFISSMDKAAPWMEYMLLDTLSKYNLSEIEGRAKAVKAVAVIIAGEKDEFVQKGYIKLAAGKLGFNLEEVSSEVKRHGFYEKRGGAVSLKGSVEKPSLKIEKAEECLIKLSASDKEIMGLFKRSITWQEFTSNNTRAIAELLQSAATDETKDAVHFMLENLPDEDSKKLFSKIIMSDHPATNTERSARDCINTIKAHHLKLQMENLRGKIIAAEKEGQLENVSMLHKEFSGLNDAYRSLSL